MENSISIQNIDERKLLKEMTLKQRLAIQEQEIIRQDGIVPVLYQSLNLQNNDI